jgi:hypothetical protein
MVSRLLFTQRMGCTTRTRVKRDRDQWRAGGGGPQRIELKVVDRNLRMQYPTRREQEAGLAHWGLKVPAGFAIRKELGRCRAG